MPQGCIVAFACVPEAYEEYTKIFPAFFMRLHYEFKLRPMSIDEAYELVKKRLNKVRIRDTDDPIYPFTEEAIKLIHQLGKGNPRQILRLLHYVLSEASKHKFDPIDDYVVTTILEEPKSLEEYLTRIPKEYKDLVEAIVYEFNGGPVSYIQIAKAVKRPGIQVYDQLNELIRLGFLVGDPKGNYKVPEYVRKFLEEGEAEKVFGREEAGEDRGASQGLEDLRGEPAHGAEDEGDDQHARQRHHARPLRAEEPFGEQRHRPEDHQRHREGENQRQQVACGRLGGEAVGDEMDVRRQ
jgi:hypothetical protein